MAGEIHDLVVSVSPEGAQETQDVLDDTREKFGETADDVGESTGMLSDFANKFTGAGIVFAGAFGTMVGAIASRMPIITEVFTGLDAVLTALALRFDRLTRDSARPFVRTLFDLADAIATPGEELRALDLTLDAIAQGLPLLAKGFLAPIEAVRRLTDAVGSLIGEMISKIAGDFAHFITTKIPALKAAFGGIVDFLKQLGADVVNAVVNNIVNPFIQRVNEMIREVNRRLDTNISTIGLLAGVDAPGGGGGGRTGRVSGPRRQTGVRDRGPALESGGEVVVTGTLDSETNLDSETVATETKPFTVKGVLGSGRGARLR